MGERIFEAVGFLLTLLMWLGCWVLYVPLQPYHVLGGVTGLSLGIIATHYHARQWDWQERRWRDTRRTVTAFEELGIFVPLAVAAGSLTARYGLIEWLVGKPLKEFLLFLVVNGLSLFLTYLAVADWRSA